MFLGYVEQLCNAYTDAISITDKDGIAIVVNDRYVTNTGISKEALLGHSVHTLQHSGVYDVVLNPRIVRTKKAATAVQTLGNGRQVVLNGYPIFDSSGNVEFVITFIRDIASLAHLQDEIGRQRELLFTLEHLKKKNDTEQPVIASVVMRDLYKKVDLIAATNATVLLLGETGVGKDVVARSIHNRSSHRDKAFIKVDCGAIPSSLIETELFGYVPGSFSGASKQGKMGLIEAAHKGTIFFDEIGELPLHTQSRLLRFLQDGEVMRVGSTKTHPVDARIIAATNRDLHKGIKAGTFRADLYYRLNIVVLSLPPLRKRKEDIEALANFFLSLYNAKYEKFIQLSPCAIKALQSYAWPGNVRELQNMMMQLVIMSRKNIVDRQFLPINATKETPELPDSTIIFPSMDLGGKSFKHIMKSMEALVMDAGLRHYGSIAKLAEAFQLDRSTTFRKLKEYNLV